MTSIVAAQRSRSAVADDVARLVLADPPGYPPARLLEHAGRCSRPLDKQV